MKSKQLLLSVFFCAAIFTAAHSQTVKNDLNYRKFRISVNAGMDYALGASGTVLPFPDWRDFTIPSSKGFGAELDGAYFLTKNYGVGLKYRFFLANGKHSSLSEYADLEDEYDYPVSELTTTSFREQTHVFGPAVYARWFLGQSKWNVSANSGVVYLYNKLSNINGKVEYAGYYPNGATFGPPRQPNSSSFGMGDRTGATVGLTLSAGIRYQLSPLIGIGISAEGLFASLSRMKYLNLFSEGYETVDIARKINRTGVSAGIDFNF
jgi:hypothetical protein